jgi:flavin-dependent dehydrogenase
MVKMASIPKVTDVVIVGGGPAGLAAAVALRQRGIDCLVIEALAPVIDKACGEGLMPDSLAALEELGICISEQDGHPFRGIRFVNTTHQVDAYFPQGAGIGVQRVRLHQRIIQRAQEAGVQVLWGSKAKLLDRQTIDVDESKVSFRWLIGADGQASRVRKWAGLHQARKEALRFGFRRHYQCAPWSEYVEVHWGPCGQMYVTPVAADSLCIVFITRHPKAAREDILASFPVLAEKLKGVSVVSQQRSAVSATRRLRRVADNSIALIGDASGSADAITGEGLAVCFRQAIALARAIEQGDLSIYRKAHAKIGKLPHIMGALMLTLDRWPGFERRAMQTLSSNPFLFDRLLSVHVGKKSLYRFAVQSGPLLGWRLLQANAWIERFR